MFLALKEMQRAKLRFGLLAGAVGLLVFLILFQQALLGGLINQFIGALKNQSADVLVYNDQARKNLEGSIILPDQLAAVAEVEGVAVAARLGESTFTVVAGGEELDAVLFGYELGGPGAPTTLVDGRLPEGPGEGVASEKDRADGFDIGDTIQVQPDGVTITVVGVARDINYSVAPVLFVDFATFEDATKHANMLLNALKPAWSMPDAEIAMATVPDTVMASIAALEQQDKVRLPQFLNGSPVTSYDAVVLGYSESLSDRDWRVNLHLTPNQTLDTRSL
jgi:hypothetical protein